MKVKLFQAMLVMGIQCLLHCVRGHLNFKFSDIAHVSGGDAKLGYFISLQDHKSDLLPKMVWYS